MSITFPENVAQALCSIPGLVPTLTHNLVKSSGGVRLGNITPVLCIKFHNNWIVVTHVTPPFSVHLA